MVSCKVLIVLMAVVVAAMATEEAKRDKKQVILGSGYPMAYSAGYGVPAYSSALPYSGYSAYSALPYSGYSAYSGYSGYPYSGMYSRSYPYSGMYGYGRSYFY